MSAYYPSLFIQIISPKALIQLVEIFKEISQKLSKYTLKRCTNILGIRLLVDAGESAVLETAVSLLY